MPQLLEFNRDKNIITSHNLVLDPASSSNFSRAFAKDSAKPDIIYHHASSFKYLSSKYLLKHNGELTAERVNVGRDLVPIAKKDWDSEDIQVISNFHRAALRGLIPFVIHPYSTIEDLDELSCFVTNSSDYEKDVKSGVLKVTRIQCASVAFFSGNYGLLCKIATPYDIKAIIRNYKLGISNQMPSKKGLVKKAENDEKILRFIQRESNIFNR